MDDKKDGTVELWIPGLDLKNQLNRRQNAWDSWIFFLNPIKPDPFEFLIGLSLCLRGTGQESQVWSHQKPKNNVILHDGIIFD